jgi:hypothetical protein
MFYHNRHFRSLFYQFRTGELHTLLHQILLQRFNIRTDYLPVRTEVESVIKKQDNPPDDLYAAVSEVVEEIIRHFSEHGHTRIIGYSVIPPGPSMPPVVFGVSGDGDRHRLPYETIETDDVLFITAQLPSDVKKQPCVKITPDAARIFIDNLEAAILVRFPVDVPYSHFSVRNGVLDITLRKLKRS